MDINFIKQKYYLDQLIVYGLRLGLYGVFCVLAVISYLSSDVFFNWQMNRDFYFCALLGVVGATVSFATWKQYASGKFILATTFFGDFAMLFYLLYKGQLSAALLFFSFLLVVLAGTVALGARFGVLLALLASVGTSLNLLLGPDLKTLNLFFSLFVNNAGFFLISYLAGLLSDQIKDQGKSISSLKQLNEIIIANMPSAILTVLPSGEVIQYNTFAQKIFGLTEGKYNIFSLMPDLKEVKAQDRQYLLKTSDSLYDLHLRIVERVLGPQRTFIFVIDDQTQIKRLEFAVRQSEKLAAVGQLAAGIAHEIRNPLTGISGSIEMLSQTTQSEDDKKLSKIILKEIDRLNRLISEFLDFARPEKPPVDSVNLKSLLNEMVGVLKIDPNHSKSKTEWIVDLDQSLLVLGVRDKLHQVFLNILVNAIQATSDRSNPKIEVVGKERSGNIEILIKDNGCGMNEANVKKMFEPFHTTKVKGTGLGLAITLKIIESHSGKIFVESQEGVGTSVTISIPAFNKSV